jgi:hypothetical protein
VSGRATRLVCLAAGLALAPAGVALAQGFRGELRVGASAIEYRTVVRDSFPEDEVPGDGLTRRLPDGTLVVCVPGGSCYRYRPGDVVTASPVTQDLSITAWPGWRGVQGRLRLRGRYGSDDLWPRDEPRLMVLDLAVEVDRPAWRARAGRLEHRGGLGTIHFDGGGLTWKASRALRAGVFGGRSLGRGLFAPYASSLLAENDALPPDRGAVLVGGEVRLSASRGLSAGLVYQREIRTDRGALYSERAALDAAWQSGPARATLDVAADVATGVANDVRLAVGRSFGPRWDVSLEGRHSRPFFELWTIWGAFMPVGYDQLRLALGWQPAAGLAVEAAAAWRDYRDTGTGTALAPIEGDGRRARAAATWKHGVWTATGGGGIDRGFGAYRGQLDLALAREWGPRTSAGLEAVGTEQFSEFRFGEGTTRGLGLSLRHGTGAIDATARLGRYFHTAAGRPGDDDYGQWRGSLELVARFGRDPAARRSALPGGAGQ